MITTAEAIERLKTRIGVDGPEVTAPVEAGHVRRFVEAIGDPNPRWTKEAPPTFLVALAPVSLHLADAEAYGQGWLNGGNRFEHFAPVMIGDQVTSKGRVVD
ncbi:MAG: MaoC family dehydratase, partial [Chloroflexi bacterium]